jgi:hypothetical protein
MFVLWVCKRVQSEEINSLCKPSACAMYVNVKDSLQWVNGSEAQCKLTCCNLLTCYYIHWHRTTVTNVHCCWNVSWSLHCTFSSAVTRYLHVNVTKVAGICIQSLWQMSDCYIHFICTQEANIRAHDPSQFYECWCRRIHLSWIAINWTCTSLCYC